MVLRPEPAGEALDALRRPGSTAVLMDPAGVPFRQAIAHELAELEHLILLCPRYEGVDDRVRSLVDREISIGDYVLSGGELAALVVLDAVIRLVPGAIEETSTVEESFADGLLEYPQYTRPAVYRGMGVPAILSSGDHGAVARWRHEESLRRTLERRPDLLEGRDLTAEDRRVLVDAGWDGAAPSSDPDAARAILRRRPSRGRFPAPATQRSAAQTRE